LAVSRLRAENADDKDAFKAKLKADGFTVVEAKVLGARPANHEHDHTCADIGRKF
jgi:hypothetical protein